MCQNGYELFLHASKLAFVCQFSLALRERFISIEAFADQLCKKPKHRKYAVFIQFARLWVDSAKCAEERPVSAAYRDRYIAAESVSGRAVVVGVVRIIVNVVDDNLAVILPDLVAERAFHVQFIARCEPERYIIYCPASHPMRCRDPSDGCKPHPGLQLNGFKQSRDGFAARNRIDIILKVVLLHQR